MAGQVKGLTVAIGADTKAFEKSIKAAQREIKKTNDDVEVLAKSLSIKFDTSKFVLAQQKAQEALLQTEAKAGLLRDRLKTLEERGQINTDEYRKVSNELVTTEGRALLLKQRLEEIRNLRIEELANKFKAVGSGVQDVANKMMPLSIAASALLTSFVAIGKSTVASADDIATVAAQLNLSAEAMQKYRYFAMQLDVTNNDLESSFRKTQGALADLAMGDTSPAAQALVTLGLSTEQAAQGMSANIDLILNRLADIQDPLIQAGLANELFGEKLGAKLIPMLQAGSNGLAELTAEFEAVGFMSNEQVASLAEFDNTMNRIKQSFIVLKNEIGVALLPVMESLATLINDKIIPAVRTVVDWFTSLSTSQKELMLTMVAVVAAAAPVLLVVGKLASGIGSIIGQVGNIGKALSMLAANPIVGVVVAIIALLGYLYATNEKFRDSINNLVISIGSALMPLFNALMSVFNSLIGALMPVVDLISGILTPAIDFLTKLLEPLVRIVVAVLTPAFKALGFYLDILGAIFGKLVSMITVVVAPVLGFLGDAIGGVFSFIADSIEGFVQGIEDALNWVVNFVNGIIQKVNSLMAWTGNQIGLLGEVDINGTMKQSVNVEASQTPAPLASASSVASNAITSTPVATTLNNTTYNNDNSTKNVTVQLTIQNYANELNYDDIITQINTRLATAM